MAILAAVHHLTHYKYDRPVILAPQIIRLKPAPHSKTKVLSHSLKVFPANHFVNLQQDGLTLAISGPMAELSRRAKHFARRPA